MFVITQGLLDTLEVTQGYTPSPFVPIFPTIFLTGDVQGNVGVGGNVGRNVATTGNVQRNVGLTGGAGT